MEKIIQLFKNNSYQIIDQNIIVLLRDCFAVGTPVNDKNLSHTGTYPAPLGAGDVGSIPTNSDAQNVPSFRRCGFEMKLSPFCHTLPCALEPPGISNIKPDPRSSLV